MVSVVDRNGDGKPDLPFSALEPRLGRLVNGWHEAEFSPVVKSAESSRHVEGGRAKVAWPGYRGIAANARPRKRSGPGPPCATRSFVGEMSAVASFSKLSVIGAKNRLDGRLGLCHYLPRKRKLYQMAKETPQAPEGAKRKRGLVFYLLVIIPVLLLPAGGWFTYQYLGKKGSGSGDSSESGGHGNGKEKRIVAPPKLAVPLVPDKVVFMPKDRGNSLTSDMIVSTNSKAPKKLIVPLADTKAPRFAMMQIFLSADKTDELIEKLNANQPDLYEKIAKRISEKTAKDINTPGFRNRMRSEVMYECNRLLGSNVVQEIIITESVTQ